MGDSQIMENGLSWDLDAMETIFSEISLAASGASDESRLFGIDSMRTAILDWLALAEKTTGDKEYECFVKISTLAVNACHSLRVSVGVAKNEKADSETSENLWAENVPDWMRKEIDTPLTSAELLQLRWADWHPEFTERLEALMLSPAVKTILVSLAQQRRAGLDWLSALGEHYALFFRHDEYLSFDKWSEMVRSDTIDVSQIAQIGPGRKSEIKDALRLADLKRYRNELWNNPVTFVDDAGHIHTWESLPRWAFDFKLVLRDVVAMPSMEFEILEGTIDDRRMNAADDTENLRIHLHVFQGFDLRKKGLPDDIITRLDFRTWAKRVVMGKIQIERLNGMTTERANRVRLWLSKYLIDPHWRHRND